MTLLRLPAAVKAQVLTAEPTAFTERQLRAVAMISATGEQAAAFEAIATARSEQRGA